MCLCIYASIMQYYIIKMYYKELAHRIMEDDKPSTLQSSASWKPKAADAVVPV